MNILPFSFDFKAKGLFFGEIGASLGLSFEGLGLAVGLAGVQTVHEDFRYGNYYSLFIVNGKQTHDLHPVFIKL